jgi:hypothetical protein
MGGRQYPLIDSLNLINYIVNLGVRRLGEFGICTRVAVCTRDYGNFLSLDMIKKADTIEHLAHSVKKKMKDIQ